MDIESSIRNEQTILREELKELKQCQLNYFLLSLSVTGAVFGFNEKFLIAKDITSLVSLAPLLIILPCWWTFFDKATTITRLIGYIRVFIEGQLFCKKMVYLGYENALSRFREEENIEEEERRKRGDKRPKVGFQWKILLVRTRHRYWMINWYTFFLLSVFCCVMPFLVGSVNPHPYYDKRAYLVYLMGISVIFSTIYTFRIVCRLINGKYAFETVTKFWEERILEKYKSEKK